jgi:hypothetical protein
MPISLKVYFGSNHAIEVTADNIDELAEVVNRTTKKFFSTIGDLHKDF